MSLDKTKKHKAFDVDFSEEGCHVSLVAEWQGGPANGQTVLITKSTKNITVEDIIKAADVRIELSMSEFLVRFFDMYWHDAERLAYLLGYESEDENEVKEVESYQSWMEESVSNITLLKSLKEQPEEFNKLDILDQIKLLKFQESFEYITKDLSTKVDAQDSLNEDITKSNEESTIEMSSTEDLNKNKGDTMSDNKETNVELEALVKAQAEMKEQMEALVKAAAEKDKELEELRKAKEEEAHRLQKALDDQAMEDAVEFVKNLSAVGDEAEREVLAKAIFELRSAPESKELLSALTKMQGALDVNMEQKGKETKEVEVITKSADDEVVNFIKAANKARK